MKVADYIVKKLKEYQINIMFGHIGGYNADILSFFCGNAGNKFVLSYNEQAAAFAVNGYSIIKETIGVAISSGAPSSCNLIPGIANAYFDSNSCVFLAGSSHSLACRDSKKIRQNAFEEIDIVNLVSDITKYAVKIKSVEDVRYEIEKAFYIAEEGRKGPVLLDIPYDIARSDFDYENARPFIPLKQTYDDFRINDVVSLLNKAKKPIILVGGGTRTLKARKHLKNILKKAMIPVVASLCGLDTLPHNHCCYLGFIGHYGNRYANLALANSDCVLILGSRLDERQLGGYKSTLEKKCKVIRVDIDKVELGRKIPETISIHAPAEDFLEKLEQANLEGLNYENWHNILKRWTERYPSYNLKIKETNANNFLHIISDYLPDDAIICADVGQNQMCVAQALRLDNQRRILNSAGYGSMGFSLPAAIGAAYAQKGTCIVSISGDGGIQMNIQELQTITRDKLAINIIILNNKCLGMIRKTQEKLFEGRTFVSVEGYSVPDFKAIAGAYKIPYLLVDSIEKYELVKDFISSQHPTMIELDLPVEMENYPELGMVLDMQEPILSNVEYSKIKEEANFEK